VTGEVLETVINGTQELFDELKRFNVNIHYLGGETADVGDVVRTIAVNGTMTARWPKNRLVTNEKIQAGDVIIGFSSFGQTVYETEYNSGIGSNGLTSARHDVLNKLYAEKYKESYENGLADNVVYIGPHRLTDTVGSENHQVGKLLLSPTRTYAPLLNEFFENYFEAIHGLIHCSGGGQTKCMKYLPGNFRVIKDNLFEPPVIFQIIQKASGSNNREMYQVFNMGHRLELFTDAASAGLFIDAAKKLGIEAQIVGRVEASDKKELVLKVGDEEIVY
jgi:phosphoribosylformylglycinamidine cyclo-ligase